MNNDLTLAEMANNTNYAAMDYYQLVALNLAFTWAGGIIKTLLPIKKKEAMEALTNNYVARTSKGVGDLVLDSVASGAMIEDNEEKAALPEASHPSITESNEASSRKDYRPSNSQNGMAVVPEGKKKVSRGKEKILVDLAIELTKKTPVAEGINPSYPYYMCCQFKKSEDGELRPFGVPCGWNMPAAALEKLKVGEKTHMESDKKRVRTTPRGDYMVYRMEGGLYKVSYFKMEGKALELDPTAIPEATKTIVGFAEWLQAWLNEGDVVARESAPSSDETSTPGKGEKVVNGKVKTPIKTHNKEPRSIPIIGTKDGETKRWSSFRECERELGAGFGSVSQFFSGKMKSVKGWTLTKVGEITA